MTRDSMTNDLTESIWKSLTASLADSRRVTSVQVCEGWGDIFYVRIRKSRSCPDDGDDLDAPLKSAVASALGEIRHSVTIDWDQPPKQS